jgi:hypothetical protein
MKIKQIHNAVATNSFESWIATVLSRGCWSPGFSQVGLERSVISLKYSRKEESDETIQYA